MDVHLFYYKKAINQIDRVYLGSQFMGHGVADNIMDDFKKVHLDIVHNLVQLSIDGPNVIWAFHEVLEESYRKIEDPNAPYLLNTGSCCLHVLHGAYKTVHEKTNWEEEKTLKAAYGIFKRSPATRADFLSDNDLADCHDDQSMKSFFPLKFCGQR